MSQVSKCCSHWIHAVGGLLLATALAAGCTWVEATPEGDEVRVVPGDRVSGCNHLGELSVYTKADVGGIDRSPNKIQQELETLARNEAATMNADTIVAVTQITNGRRTYQVYRCL
jgi:hypothetical protein